MNNVMVDLETYAVTQNAQILSIGAVKFNELGLVDLFFVVIQPDTRFDIDLSTLAWWESQDRGAKDQFLEMEPVRIERALRDLAAWLGEDPIIWGNGASFDNSILSNAYERCNLPIPWKFWNNRCYRTMKNMYPGIAMPEKRGVVHHALNDAEHQALHLIQILKFHNAWYNKLLRRILCSG